MNETLLQVKNLVTSFKLDSGVFAAVDDISFNIKKGESVGLVGESGSGKSVTSLSILNLIQSPGFIEQGSILFEDQDLIQLNRRELRAIRGNKISMIFQEPMTSLNPVFTVGDQIGEVFRIHRNFNRKEARLEAIKMLKLVKIPAPEKRVDEYPHQLSGGMRQRVMIAMAIACKPNLLIADEPTTALDVTIQAQVLEIISELRHELGMSLLLITHDLGVVAETCDRVMVMYGGKIVESGTIEEIYEHPKHPYTVGLLNSIPKLGVKVDELPTIQGIVPSLGHFPAGCKFQNRCPYAEEICRRQEPLLKPLGDAHEVACWVVSGESNGEK